MAVSVRRQGEWLVVEATTMTRCYPAKTTADDLDAWADAQGKRISEAVALHDMLRAAAEEMRSAAKK